MLLTPVQIKPKSFESRWNSFLFFTRGGCASCLRAYLGARLLPQSYQYPNLSEGADRVGGQLRGDKECNYSGVTKSGRVWKKVPESDVWSVEAPPPSSLSLVPSRRIKDRFLFPRLSLLGDRWCDVFDFVSAGCVSRSSTLQMFRDGSHL